MSLENHNFFQEQETASNTENETYFIYASTSDVETVVKEVLSEYKTSLERLKDA